MKNQTPRWRKALYRVVLFPVALVAIGYLALNLIQSEPATTTAGLKSANVLVVTTQAQMKVAATKIQAAATSNQAVFIAIVDGAFGAEQTRYLDEVASKYKDQIQFVITSSERGMAFVQLIAPLAGKVAFPMMFIETPSGKKAVHVGMMTAPELEAFISSNLRTAP